MAISRNGDTATEMLSDSALISEKLVVDDLAEDLNLNLTAAEKAQDLAFRALLEDKLYFYQVRNRHMTYFVVPIFISEADGKFVLLLGLRTLGAKLLYHEAPRPRRPPLSSADSRRTIGLSENDSYLVGPGKCEVHAGGDHQV